MYCVVRHKKDLETKMYTSNHYPDKDLYLDDFVWVSGNWEFQADDLDCFSFLRFRGYVPAEGSASVVGDEEKDVEVEEGEEVNQGEEKIPNIAPPTQILAVEPVLVLNSNFKAADDLAFPKVAPATEDFIEHSFNLGGSSGSSSGEEVGLAPKIRALGKKKVTNASSSRDYETCLALGNAIMLPQDVSYLDGEGLEEFKDKLIMQSIQAHNKAKASLAQLNKALQKNVELKRVASKEGAAVEVGTILDNELDRGRGEDVDVDVALGNELGKGKVEGVVGAEGVGADEENPPKE
ncbi:hypothetical protein Acr_00g0026590 [Actinidia rufa]|uniref:Uncharacterized protein n=1 Tax=Actinidia rufa TaxID=165716 RepID=A0A7J0DDP2_9ERIC|nr:hypothetical protein Acr_00g0026590 [Actinidia rufa]